MLVEGALLVLAGETGQQAGPVPDLQCSAVVSCSTGRFSSSHLSVPGPATARTPRPIRRPGRLDAGTEAHLARRRCVERGVGRLGHRLHNTLDDYNFIVLFRAAYLAPVRRNLFLREFLLVRGLLLAGGLAPFSPLPLHPSLVWTAASRWGGCLQLPSSPAQHCYFFWIARVKPIIEQKNSLQLLAKWLDRLPNARSCVNY